MKITLCDFKLKILSVKLKNLESGILNFNPQNILIINFGQIGDVILSLPALKAVREKFPEARITALVGKSGTNVVEISGFVDEKITVDRVLLRDSGKIWSTRQIFKIVKDIRNRRFDFIIDLHSLYETNLLGFFSGAKHRLYAKRGNRSLDFLANFLPAPPDFDRTKHLTDYYLSVLKPLGIEDAERFVTISLPKDDLETIENLLQKENFENENLIGMFPGAGHENRRWKLENFAELAKLLSAKKNIKIIVFLGPEEASLRREIDEIFPSETIIFDDLTLMQFTTVLSRLQVLISNDTGAAHLAAIAGTWLVLIMDKRAPTTYLPLTEKICIINSGTLDEIDVEEVFQATQKILAN